MRRCAVLLALFLLPGIPASGGAGVPNADMEAAGPGGVPAGWDVVVIGPAPRFSLDAGEKHGGRQSACIAASEVSRAYVRSGPVPVAPGERVRVGVWVKHRDKPADQGAVIAIAEFDGADGTALEIAKVGTAGPDPGWQHVEGVVTVPPFTSALRVRLGFSYSYGTCWWDDLSIQPEKPLVARLDLPSPRVVPSMGGLPVTILNREGRRGSVRLRLRLGTAETEARATLTGESAQGAAVPLKVAERGDLALSLSLLAADVEAPLFTEEGKVTVPPPLAFLPLTPTHWIAEEGEPRFEGEIEMAVTRSEWERGTLDARVLDAAGQVRGRWSARAGDLGDDGAIRFDLRIPGLPQGDYRVAAQFQPAQGDALTAEQPWSILPRQRVRVLLGAAGYPEQDGKSVFPLGIFNTGARIAEAGAAGFTVAHAYNAVLPVKGRKPNYQRAKDFLDETLKAGMHALYLIPRGYAEEGNWEGMRRTIRMFRNHPALLAWDEEEEIARGDMKPESLQRVAELIRAEDPNHPLMVGDSRDVIGRVTDRSHFFPLPAMDLGMWWWYPLPPGPRAGSALQGEELAKGFLLDPPSFLTERDTEKPIWVGVQCYKKPWEGARYPNPTEYRLQAYLALIHGAKGLMWYGGSVRGGLFLSPREGNWDYLKKLAGELQALAPILMAPNGEAPAFEPAGAALSVAVKRAGGRTLLLAANRSPQPVDAAFALDGPVPTLIAVLREDRTVSAADGKLRDRFEGYAVHLYELP